MSGGPDFELQKAVAARLKADATLVSLTGVNARIFQDVTASPTFPYITIGESQNLPDKAECIDGSEIFITLHVYSKAPGFGQVKAIAAAISDSLDEAALDLDEHDLFELTRDSVLFRTDPDNVIKHAILVFRALTEPVA